MDKQKIWKEFYNENSLFVAEPILKATDSWRFLDDVPDKEKATPLFFGALAEAKAKIYMTIVRKGQHNYAKLYIVLHTQISILYVKTDAVFQGKRYHRNQGVN